MLNRRTWVIILSLILAIAVVTGCGKTDKRTANQILQDSLNKSSEIISASFDGQLQLNIEVSDDLKATLSEDEVIGLDMLKNAKISYKGNIQSEPQQAEIVLSADLPIGDLQTHIDLPILVTDKNMWVKIPNFPGVGEMAGKFVELNFEELAKLSGESATPTLDPETQKQLSKDFSSIFFKNFDESYFSKADIKSLNLPANVEVDHAVEFKVTQEQIGPFMTTIVDKILPEFLDLMTKPEYKDLFGITTDEVDQIKTEMSNSKSDIDEMVTEINKNATNSLLSIVTAIDKDGFTRQSLFNLSSDIKNPEGAGTIKFNLKFVMNTTKINEKVTFENSFPPAQDQVIPFEELMSSFMGMGMIDNEELPIDYDTSSEDGTDSVGVTDEEMDLWNELMTQPWFLDNATVISEKANSDENFANDMNNPEVIRSLIDDADFRKEFFTQYGIEIVE